MSLEPNYRESIVTKELSDFITNWTMRYCKFELNLKIDGSKVNIGISFKKQK